MEIGINFLGIEDNGWGAIVLAILIFFCIGYHIFLMYSIKARLKKQHPDLWKKLTHDLENSLGKEFYQFTTLGDQIEGSALVNFVKKRIYLELDDEILIRKGNRARLISYTWLYVFIGYVFFMWSSALYQHCKEFAPEGFGAVWDCLIAIP